MADFTHGRFVWHDLITTDMKAAETFYKGLGWGVKPFPESKDPYDMWTIGDKPVGGVMTMPEAMRAIGTPPHWIPYVSVRDLDLATDHAAALGGRILSAPEDVPTVGRLSVISDPAGGACALFTPLEAPTQKREAQLGEFGWHEMGTTDLEVVWSFYKMLFGWEPTSEFDMGAAGTYRMFGQDGESYGAMYQRPDDSKMTPYWLSYIRVSDVGNFADVVIENGGVVASGPMDAPGGGRVVVFRDRESAMCAARQTT